MTIQSVAVSVMSAHPASDVSEGVVKSAANVAHRLDRAAAADAVGQQDEVAIAVRIVPQRRAGEADVAEGRRRHPGAAGRRGKHRVPAERARAAGYLRT